VLKPISSREYVVFFSVGYNKSFSNETVNGIRQVLDTQHILLEGHGAAQTSFPARTFM
jgi:hypothetical protein